MSNKVYFPILLIWLITVTAVTDGASQVYFQFERAHSLTVRKYGPGDVIEFKSMLYPDYWQKGKIIQILPNENAIVFEDRISYLRDFTHFKYYRPWPNGIGTNLMRFSGAWILFAGVIEGGRSIGVLETNYKFGTDTAFIGITAFLSGFLLKKIWGVSINRLNNKNRVRIVDIRP